jgi:hypothetical protein
LKLISDVVCDRFEHGIKVVLFKHT